MPKPKLHQWHQSGATDGQVVTWDQAAMDGAGEWTAQDPAGGGVQSIVEGTGITVDDTDPANPIVSATGGGGGGGGSSALCRLKPSTGTNMLTHTANNVQAQVTGWALDVDTTGGSMWDSSNPNQITAPSDGIYLVTAQVWPLNSSYGLFSAIQIRVNGSTRTYRPFGNMGSDWWARHHSDALTLDAGDVITIWMEWRDSTATIATDTTQPHGSTFSATLLG